ncbi:MAG: hypothetical protein Q8936_16340 [Bacillota bacterium]|nr:hypothetical protein [Bacillota bacterium]
MAKMEEAPSWSIIISHDDSLNFSVFVACIYGLIDKRPLEEK